MGEIPKTISTSSYLPFQVTSLFPFIVTVPGYGWSEAPSEPGFDVKSAALVFTKLMQRLNYNRYVAAGGDWGIFGGIS
jgi:hypothetical protein